MRCIANKINQKFPEGTPFFNFSVWALGVREQEKVGNR